MSWSTSELRVRLAPLNRFKPSSKIFYWTFQGGTSFVDLLCFCSVLCLLCFVRVCLYVLCGHLLGKGWPLGSRLWCLLWVCHFPIGILGQVWYLIVSIPDLCTITYFSVVMCLSRQVESLVSRLRKTMQRNIHTQIISFVAIIWYVCIVWAILVEGHALFVFQISLKFLTIFFNTSPASVLSVDSRCKQIKQQDIITLMRFLKINQQTTIKHHKRGKLL